MGTDGKPVLTLWAGSLPAAGRGLVTTLVPVGYFDGDMWSSGMQNLYPAHYRDLVPVRSRPPTDETPDAAYWSPMMAKAGIK